MNNHSSYTKQVTQVHVYIMFMHIK